MQKVRPGPEMGKAKRQTPMNSQKRYTKFADRVTRIELNELEIADIYQGLCEQLEKAMACYAKRLLDPSTPKLLVESARKRIQRVKELQSLFGEISEAKPEIPQGLEYFYEGEGK
jgi:hypothetical protein